MKAYLSIKNRSPQRKQRQELCVSCGFLYEVVDINLACPNLGDIYKTQFWIFIGAIF